MTSSGVRRLIPGGLKWPGPAALLRGGTAGLAWHYRSNALADKPIYPLVYHYDGPDGRATVRILGRMSAPPKYDLSLLKPDDWRILRYLYRRVELIKISDLADDCNVDRSNLGKRIIRLEKDGWCERPRGERSGV
jgi:hypothetical protein